MKRFQPRLSSLLALALTFCASSQIDDGQLPAISPKSPTPIPHTPTPPIVTSLAGTLPPPVSIVATPTQISQQGNDQSAASSEQLEIGIERSPTPIPASPTPKPHPPTLTPQPPLSPCNQRVPDPEGLLTFVNREFGLAPDYAPPDLVDLADYFPRDVTKGYNNQMREIIAEPLQQLVADMQDAGMRPTIISAYRSYAQQNIAWNKWRQQEPYGANLSAPPGHSEHQLGTTVDFGSPELAGIVGDDKIEFHTWFYRTSEGVWLLANAHRFGFSLSYPADGFEQTGFYYEPWHYRFIGVEMATDLYEQGVSLTDWHHQHNPRPCLP